MSRAQADRWTKVAHAVVVVVLILGPLWVAWGLISQMPFSDPAAEARCAQLGCDGPLVPVVVLLPFVAMALLLGGMVWLGALGLQVVLAFEEQSRRRLAGVALIDACWVAAAAWGLQTAVNYGRLADDARRFAWLVIAVAAADIAVCVVRVVASPRVAVARLGS